MRESEARVIVGFGVGKLHDRAQTSEEMLEALYDTYAPALFRYALALLNSADDAEDAVQTVFIRVARECKRIKKIENIKAYLFTATRNAAYSILRSRQRRNEVSDEALSGLAAEDTDDTPMAIQECLARLPVEQREVIVLKVFDGMTFEEIAKTVGESPNTVASRYRYGIEKLRHALESDRNER